MVARHRMRKVSENRLLNPIYARDIDSMIRNDRFMGKGFEKLVKKADKKGNDVVVGRFYQKPYVDE